MEIVVFKACVDTKNLSKQRELLAKPAKFVHVRAKHYTRLKAQWAKQSIKTWVAPEHPAGFSEQLLLLLVSQSGLRVKSHEFAMSSHGIRQFWIETGLRRRQTSSSGSGTRRERFARQNRIGLDLKTSY